MNYQMDYFYGHEANQFTFFRIPKLLFSDERFIGLTSDAKILYGLMLDRMGLSVKNGWIDEKNHVYIYFTLEEAMEYMRIYFVYLIRTFLKDIKDARFQCQMW